MPPERWNDQAIDQLAKTVEAFGPVVGQAIQTETELEATQRAFEEHRREVERVEQRMIDKLEDVLEECKEWHKDTSRRFTSLERTAKERLQGRRMIVVAVIGASGVVVAALITTIVTLLTHGAA